MQIFKKKTYHIGGKFLQTANHMMSTTPAD